MSRIPNTDRYGKLLQAGDEIGRQLRKRLQEIALMAQRLREDDM
jgi:hypothetical protein